MWAQIFVHALLFNLSFVACQIIFDSREEHNIEDPASVKLWRLLPKRHTNRRSLSLAFSRSTKENISTQPSPTLPVPRTSIEKAGELSRNWENDAIIFEEADKRDTVLPVKLQAHPTPCLPSETRFGTNYQCVGILTQGPCPIGKWVIINESTREPECADRPPECGAVKSEKTERCAQAALRMKQTTDTETIETCDYGKGMALAFTKSGDVVCECRRGFLYWEAGDQCFEAYNKGPCGNGEYIGLTQATESYNLPPKVTTTKMPITTEAYQPPKPSYQIQEIPLARRIKTKRQMEILDRVVQSTKRQKETASTSVREIVKVPMTTSTEGSLSTVVDDDMAQIPEVHDTTDDDKDADTVTPATGEARQGNDEQYLFDVKCIVNSCPEGLIPINLNILARSPGSNIRNADELNNSDTGATIILGHDQSLIVAKEPQDSIVCDKIGGQRDCLANYALSINPDSLEPECVALNDRSVFYFIPMICAGRIDGHGNCIRARRRTIFG